MSSTLTPIRRWLASLLVPPKASPRHTARHPARPSALPSALTGTPARTLLPKRWSDAPLVLVDAQNLSYSLRKHGLDCDFEKLLRTIRVAAPYAQAHAFVRLRNSQAALYARNYFKQAGWVPHCAATQTNTNADNDILLAAGELCSRHAPRDLLLCTGDGDLGCDIALYVAKHYPRTRVHILAIAGNMSRRLDARHNAHITSSALLGMDCIGPAN